MRTIKFRTWDTRFNDMHYHADVRTWHLNMPDLEECTLMQFTGILDKKGEEIYEGDVLELIINKFAHKRVVEWDEHKMRFRLTKKHNGKSYNNNEESPFYVHNYTVKDHVVIGNIYEHPELLN